MKILQYGNIVNESCMSFLSHERNLLAFSIIVISRLLQGCSHFPLGEKQLFH